MKTKSYCLFIIIFFSFVANAQVKTIKVRKELPVCDFELIADSNLLGKNTRLSKFTFIGLSKREIDDVRILLRYVRTKILTIDHDFIIPNVAGICDLKKKKLKSIEVVKSDEETEVGIDGNLCCYVVVYLKYVDKPKKPR